MFNRGIEPLRFNDSIGFDSVQPVESYHLTGYGDCFANINRNERIYTWAEAECTHGDTNIQPCPIVAPGHTVKNTDIAPAYGDANIGAQLHPVTHRNANPGSGNCHPSTNGVSPYAACRNNG